MKHAVSALTIAVCAGLTAPQAAFAAAFYFESRTTTEGEGLGRKGQVMNVRAWIDGASAKIEFTEGDQMGFFTEGTYMLTSDGGQVIYLVNPAEMTYSEMNIDEMLSMASTVMQAAGGIVQMEFGDVTNDKVAEGPGGEILGYPTTRHEYRTAYTMTMGVLGFNRSTRNETQQELWCTDEFDAEGFRVWLSPDRFRTGNPELDEFIEAQYQDLDCLPLRTRTVSTMTGERGRAQTTTSTTEVTVLREESSFPASTFELPGGFAAVPLLPELPADFAAPGEADAQAPSGEESTQEQPRLRLRDLLRR